MIATATRVELSKVFSKWRTYIGFIALGVVIPIVIISLDIEGMKFFSFATQNLQQQFIFSGNLMNGYTTSYLIIGMLYVHVPFLVTLVAGDILAGEATGGTYRLLLTRPLSRATLVNAKYIAVLVSTNLLIVFMAVLSLGLGLLILGSGDMVVVRTKISVITESDILWRFMLAYGFGVVAMTAVSSIAFLLSSFVENAIGPIMTTMAIIIVMLIISSINASWMDAVRPWFFTTHLNSWRYLFDRTVDWTPVVNSSIILFMHSVVCFVVAHFVIHRKDILS